MSWVLHLVVARELSVSTTIARVLNVDGFSWSLHILFVTCLGEQFRSLRMMPSWVIWVHSRGDGSRVHNSQVADDKIVS